MSLLDGDTITKPALAVLADLLRNAGHERTTVLVDSVGRTLRITCADVDREWLKALAAAGASGNHSRPGAEALTARRRGQLERAVAGALRTAIKDHGPITADLLTSAAKRVVGNLGNAGITGG